MHLKELKKKSPADLVAMSEEMGVEGASTMRKQDLMFSILKIQAENGVEIMGSGTIEVLNDGFGFLRSPEANYLAGPDDIYVAPSTVRRFGLRTGDTVEGEIRGIWRRAQHTLRVEAWARLSRAMRDSIEAEARTLPLPVERDIEVVWS